MSSVPTLDMNAVEESRELQRKPSFTKKMSSKIKNLVTPRGGKASPTLTSTISNPSSSISLIRVPSMPPKPAAEAPSASAAVPKPAAVAPSAPAAAPKPAVEAAPAPAKPVAEEVQQAPEPATPVAAEEEQAAFEEVASAPERSATTVPAPAEAVHEKIAAQVEDIKLKAAAMETEAPKSGNGLARGLLTAAIIAVAAGTAMAISGGSKAVPVAVPAAVPSKSASRSGWRK